MGIQGDSMDTIRLSGQNCVIVHVKNPYPQSTHEPVRVGQAARIALYHVRVFRRQRPGRRTC